MIPKSGKSPAESRKSVGIHELAALARSSLNGISQAVRDHVTKPTSLAQGRVAHLIEWKGWPKPTGPSAAAQSQFSSYCHLSEGEKEARFAAGVAEQFAIAEAKLRAWASTDDDEEDDSNDEDFNINKTAVSAQSSDTPTSNLCTRAPHQAEVDSAAPPTVSVGSSLLYGRPQTHSEAHSSQSNSPTLPSNSMSPFLEEEEEEEEEEQEEKRLDVLEKQLAAPLQRSEVSLQNKAEWRPRGHSSRFDSCYSTSHSESPEEEDEEDEEEEECSVFQEVRVWHCSQRSFFSDRASSGVASFDEEEEREDVEEKKEDKEFLM